MNQNRISGKFIITALAALFLLAKVSFAQNENEPVPSVDYAFGQSINFSLTINGASDVEKITLFIQPDFSSNLYVVDVSFTPGNVITATYPVDPVTLGLKPYSDLAYSWEIDTTLGSFHIPERKFSYEDDRFVWQKMSQDAATVHWTGNGPFFGQNILDIASAAQKRLSTILPIENITPYNLYVYPSSADLRAGLRLAKVDDEQNTQPELDAILITSVNPQTAVGDMEMSIPYELTHLLLHRIARENYSQFPWWLKEGIAQSVQVRSHPRQEEILHEAMQPEATIPLWRLCQDPGGDADRTLLASVQAVSLVEFIRSRYGESMLTDLVAAYSRGDNCEVGVHRVLNKSLDDLDEEWLESNKPASSIQEFINNYGLWLAIIAAIIFFAILLIWLSIRVKE